MNPRQMVTFATGILLDHENNIVADNFTAKNDINYVIALALTSIADNYDRWVNGT